MAATDDRETRTAQKLVRYEALFTLLDDIQRLDDVVAIAQRAARQWKYISSVAMWRLVVERSGRRVTVNAARGEAEVLEGPELTPWDEHHWREQRAQRLAADDLLAGPPPPDFLSAAAVREIEVMPFARQGQPVGLLTVAARHRPFDDLDRTFTRMLGGHLTDRFADILLRQHATEALMTRATRDTLTGLLNRGAIIEQLAVRVATLTDQPVAVILADVDFFKVVNDTRGHLIGDEVLREISRRLQLHARSGDGVGRYGGEEFLIVIQPCGPDQAARAAERVRRAVAEEPIVVSEGPPVTVTLSLGTATTADAGWDVSRLLKSADDALYRAKAGGRNRVCRGVAD